MHKHLYGLPKKTVYQLMEVFKKYAMDIEEVILFGSRARGDFKPSSDIDLAIKFRNNDNQYYDLVDELTEITMIYTVDAIDYEKIQHLKLKENIDREGIPIFLSNKKGEVLITMNKVKDRLINFEKALVKLQQSLVWDVNDHDLVLDATIQRFEFTYELAWKLMKSYLEYSGHTEVSSPRATMRVAFQNQLIEDGDGWITMLGDRNRTSHTYDQETAMEIYSHIKSKYIHLFDQLFIEMNKRLDHE